jgi:hypothetical protein
MYIVSQDTRTIYEMSFGGTFFNSYRAYDESRFASISGVATDPGLQMIYTISGNSVLAFEKGD